ncbi:ATP-binding cassette domain-containing protein [Herbidospora solisilvae]|nr:ATP-binding cassette domain-containing protein [Herbidospora solisilvae]
MVILEAQSLTKRFGAVHGVNGVSFTVGQGEITGLLGHNGAGKPKPV